jgi:hypothetical protein
VLFVIQKFTKENIYSNGRSRMSETLKADHPVGNKMFSKRVML